MSNEFFEQYKELNLEKVPFATAIVVNRVEPSSGKPVIAAKYPLMLSRRSMR